MSRKIFIILFTTVIVVTAFNEPLDLTWGVGPKKTLNWPISLPFSFVKKIGYKTDTNWYAANDFCTGEHAGTHLDAPYHFNVHGWKVGEIPISRLIAPASVIDVSAQVGNNRTFALQTSHLEDWEEKYGEFPINSYLLVRFGWSQHYSSREAYFGSETHENLSFPAIDKTAAEWIVKSGKFFGVGLDTPSVDIPTKVDTHTIFAAASIFGLENVKMLEPLPAGNFTLIVMPMKISEGTGAPVRIVAVPKKFGCN